MSGAAIVPLIDNAGSHVPINVAHPPQSQSLRSLLSNQRWSPRNLNFPFWIRRQESFGFGGKNRSVAQRRHPYC
jgi:hypothetical protein